MNWNSPSLILPTVTFSNLLIVLKIIKKHLSFANLPWLKVGASIFLFSQLHHAMEQQLIFALFPHSIDFKYVEVMWSWMRFSWTSSVYSFQAFLNANHLQLEEILAKSWSSWKNFKWDWWQNYNNCKNVQTKNVEMVRYFLRI